MNAEAFERGIRAVERGWGTRAEGCVRARRPTPAAARFSGAVSAASPTSSDLVRRGPRSQGAPRSTCAPGRGRLAASLVAEVPPRAIDRQGSESSPRAEHVPEAALDWLSSSNRALGGDEPVSLLDTELGAKRVFDVLGRIEHGVYG